VHSARAADLWIVMGTKRLPIVNETPAKSADTIDSRDVEKVYDRYASWYDHLFGAVLDPGRRAVAQAVQILGPSSILEVGVGTGLTLPFYPENTRIVGIDLSAHMLARAHERAASLPRHDIELHVMDAESMIFESASFDCVVLPYVLSVTPDPARLINEVRRVCRPSGHVVIVNHFSGSRTWWLLERLVRPLAARIGFRSDFGFTDNVLSHDWIVESVRTVNLFGLSRVVVLRNG
jgi:phosphatidylethanolamine/phosphatidyl-N-methylethanolamine N-methyltransferase